MLIEALVGINVAVAGENPGLKDAFTKLTAEEKRAIYLETLTQEQLEQIDKNTQRLGAKRRPDPYWCYYDDELFAVVIDTCGPNPRTLSKTTPE